MSRQQIHAKFRDVTERAGLGRTWQPRECRHTFVSVMSDAGEDIESISAAVGHKNSAITKVVYRHVIADKLTRAATTMDRVNLAAGGGA